MREEEIWNMWEPKFTPSILMNKIAEESQVNTTFLEGPDSLRQPTTSDRINAEKVLLRFGTGP